MISVIVPVYNRVELLKRALASILAQTYKDIEVIVVDDGSSEKLQIQNYKFQTDVPIRLLRQENKGAPAARNRGLAEAKGEYVIFWDADVVGRPEMLEKLKRQLDINPEASFAYCNHVTRITYHVSKKMPAREFNIEELKKNNYIHSTSLIRRRDAIKWDESLKRFQDWDLWLTMAEMGKTGVWVDEYLFTVLGGGTMSKWLPRFAYKAPFKWLPFVKSRVITYEEAKKVILAKHHIFNLLNTR